ncbi:tail completion protein gp17 [Allorhizobium undicola]|uniref:tail completion protein gp17 n=1 Tax=Allorhizobium undicola TaxID=78527 RepID=UPI003D358003
MEEAVTALLLADARLAALIGNRVHWGRVPQGAARPYLILQLISGVPDYASAGRTGLEQSRLQLDAYAESVAVAKAISVAASDALEKARGTYDGVRLQGAFIDGRRDSQPDSTSGAAPVFRRSTDLIIWHS